MDGQLTKVNSELDEIKSDLNNQKVAYDVLLGQLSNFEKTETDLMKQVEALADAKKKLTEQVENLEKELKDSRGRDVSRNSIGSDNDDYSSVQEMKDHLKHAR